MRLFTGIAIEERLVEKLRVLVEQMRLSTKLKWSPRENYHVTTKFLGECAEEKIESIGETLERVPRPCEFEMAIEGLGFFPNARAPRVFWAGVIAPPELTRLASDTEAALRLVGIPSDVRAYSPHLTLARVKAGQSVAAIADQVALLTGYRFGGFRVREFYLYQSRAGAHGSIYQKLRQFDLGGKENY